MRVLTLVLLFTGLAQPGQPDRAAMLDGRGRTEFQLGRYRQAATYFEQSLRLTAKGTEAEAVISSNAGQAYLALGNRARAEESFRRAIAILPGSARLWHLLGQVYVQEKHFPEAESALRQALEIWGDSQPEASAIALNDLAIVYQARRQPGQAMETLEKAASLVPPGQAGARTRANLGTTSWKLGQKQQAVLWLSRALAEMQEAVGPEHPDVAHILEDYAVVLRGTGHDRDAKTCEQRARGIRSSFAAQSGTKTVDWRDLK